MEKRWIWEIGDIYRLKVPFENLYTSIFLIRREEGAILVDCATTPYDVDQILIPALEEFGIPLESIRGLVLTHRHDDHAGGLSRILYYAPAIEVITDLRTLLDGLITYPMAGHTEDMIGVLDVRSHTLISGDGLQGAGVGRYPCSTKNPEAYRETIRRIRKDQRIENILLSHAYEPWNQDRMMGRSELEACLSDCEKYGKGEIK